MCPRQQELLWRLNALGFGSVQEWRQIAAERFAGLFCMAVCGRQFFEESFPWAICCGGRRQTQLRVAVVTRHSLSHVVWKFGTVGVGGSRWMLCQQHAAFTLL